MKDDANSRQNSFETSPTLPECFSSSRPPFDVIHSILFVRFFFHSFPQIENKLIMLMETRDLFSLILFFSKAKSTCWLDSNEKKNSNNNKNNVFFYFVHFILYSSALWFKDYFFILLFFWKDFFLELDEKRKERNSINNKWMNNRISFAVSSFLMIMLFYSIAAALHHYIKKYFQLLSWSCMQNLGNTNII